MKYMRRTAGYIWTDYKTNAQIAKELKITPILDNLLEYKRNWIQHVNRMSRNRLPRVMKRYSPTGRRYHGRPLKRLLDTWDRNGSTSGPTPWQIYDDHHHHSWQSDRTTAQLVSYRSVWVKLQERLHGIRRVTGAGWSPSFPPAVSFHHCSPFIHSSIIDAILSYQLRASSNNTLNKRK